MRMALPIRCSTRIQVLSMMLFPSKPLSSAETLSIALTTAMARRTGSGLSMIIPAHPPNTQTPVGIKGRDGHTFGQVLEHILQIGFLTVEARLSQTSVQR